MVRHLTVVILTLFASLAQAQDSALRRLDTGEDSRGWNAVGRLELADRGFCTGALIAPDQVLTAAHCLFDKETGDRLRPEQIEFQAGLRNGRAEAYRKVARAVIHPSYEFRTDVTADRVRNDLAILELSHPIRNQKVMPFQVSRFARSGDSVGLVSYAHDRAEAPSMQDYCTVIGRQQGVFILSCEVDFGSSGAPVFSFEDGHPRIVSVVSAKAAADGEPVSLGSQLDGSVDLLRNQLRANVGVMRQPISQAKRVRVGDAEHTSGAKFLSR